MATVPPPLNNAGLGNRGDGWQGTGTLTATSAWVMGLTRINRTQAVVLIQVQATAGDPAVTIQLKVAVPLDTSSSPPTPSALPTLIGTLTSALSPQPEIASSDDAFGTSTGTVMSTLMQAYGSGQLEFTRAPGTTFAGLSGQVTSGRVTAWTPALADPATPQTRSGLVTTTWTLPGGAGVAVLPLLDLHCAAGRPLAAAIRRPRTDRLTTPSIHLRKGHH